jgi:hypothetical protein
MLVLFKFVAFVASPLPRRICGKTKSKWGTEDVEPRPLEDVVVDFVARVMPERHEEYIGERQICLSPSPLSDLMPVPYFTSFESLG